MKKINFEEENYNIHMLQTDRFHRISFSVIFERNIKEEDFAYSSLLINVLDILAFKSIKEKKKKRLEIYSPNYELSIDFKGNHTLLFLKSFFIDEKYTEKGMNEKSVKYLLHLIYNESIIKNKISKEAFETAKAKTLNHLKSLPDNQEYYALQELKSIQKIYSFKIPNTKRQIELIENISEDDIYNYYIDLLNNSRIEIFFVGNIDRGEVEKILNKNFNPLPRNIELKELYLKSQSEQNDVVKIEQTQKQQSILFKSYYLDNLTDFEKMYVLPILHNTIGNNRGLLYDEIRSKNSLCYFIFSFDNREINRFYIYTGINSKNYELVNHLIEETLEKVKCNDFKDSFFINAKNLILTDLDTVFENQSILTTFFQEEIILNKDSLENQKSNYQQVTKADVSALVKKLKPDVTFLLKGED